MKAAEELRRSPDLQKLLKDRENIFLILNVDEDRNSCSYYLVSHHDQHIFWSEHHKPEVHCTSKLCKRAPQLSKLHCILAQYWKHCKLFPTTLALASELIGDMKDVLIQASAGRDH
ncbi:hypothetical protein SCLCIDRAFT_212614 [Scleroderma citrinum Foug A]|uniref:Uncharacterized protein n=1 Tax=Scleroderma citrinum Foug A TaxID=1036808 RepID=A0A0C2Z415_9AGAM|nr:hypothetical protein SCLCIDRAFT_212614 [Scleroderma citrinum Foug A]